MNKSKKESGFGFHELQAFNIDFLSSMVARVLSEPDALWVRVLKDPYFPSTDFLQALKESRVAWGWSSLLTRRDVIREEGVWSLGDG